MEHPFFYLGLALILMHEMDAIRCKEWRIFPGLSFLDDTWGMRIFMVAHIPLYYFLLKGLQGPKADSLMIGLDYFFIIHLGLHLIFLLHKRNEFKDWLSWSLITGCAICGIIDILVT